MPRRSQETENRAGVHIARLAADYFRLNSDRTSVITVTRATASRDNKSATVYISVIPDSSMQAAINFCKRRRSDLRKFIMERGRLSRIPNIECEIDKGEKNRQRIDEISRG